MPPKLNKKYRIQNIDTSGAVLTMMGMSPIMWKLNRFYHSVNIRWHSFKCADQFRYTGVNQDISIVHRRELIEVIGLSQSELKLNANIFHSPDETETQVAFAKHFDVELALYKSICIINLVEQSGKEKIIFDAYGNHVVKYNNDQLIYVTFDFHEYW